MRSSKGGQLREKGGYPADTEKVRAALIGLSRLERVEAKTSNPDRYDRLGVGGEGRPDSIVLGLQAGSESLATIILGRTDSGAANRRYLRSEGEPGSWLVSGRLAVEPTAMVHGVRHREDHRILVGVDGVLDGDVHILRPDDMHPVGLAVLGRDAEDHQRGPAADLVARRELDRLTGDLQAVDERAVGRIEITQVPAAVVGREFGVAAAHGRVAQRQRLGGPPDQLWLVRRQAESHAPVRALENVKHQHASIVGAQ